MQTHAGFLLQVRFYSVFSINENPITLPHSSALLYVFQHISLQRGLLGHSGQVFARIRATKDGREICKIFIVYFYYVKELYKFLQIPAFFEYSIHIGGIDQPRMRNKRYGFILKTALEMQVCHL